MDDDELSLLTEFNEILQLKYMSNLNRLRNAARHGIPAQVRGDVWQYLLGVQHADRSKELSFSKARAEDYKALEHIDNESSKRVKGEMGRYARRVNFFSSKENCATLEHVVTAYLNNNRDVDYYPALVPICAPFVITLKEESDAYYCFERLMKLLDEHFATNSINEQVANFMTLFRFILPDLHSYFEEEEVDLNEWATSWLQYLLAKELPFENLVRLWDTYFSYPDPMDLHPYVCLAILRTTKENLEDLEQSEIRTMLMRLPNMDITRIIAQAQNLRHETMERQLYEDNNM
ncbi:unnamed protein product [Umbelopsis ramanniana]